MGITSLRFFHALMPVLIVLQYLTPQCSRRKGTTAINAEAWTAAYSMGYQTKSFRQMDQAFAAEKKLIKNKMK